MLCKLWLQSLMDILYMSSLVLYTRRLCVWRLVCGKVMQTVMKIVRCIYLVCFNNNFSLHRVKCQCRKEFSHTIMVTGLAKDMNFNVYLNVGCFSKMRNKYSRKYQVLNGSADYGFSCTFSYIWMGRTFNYRAMGKKLMLFMFNMRVLKPKIFKYDVEHGSFK
jgi:hypothetical protein